jgi:signal transduction histidine kinase/ligand-binding sensor domain-containing protein/DNA-binding response OmpR family regulator
MAIMIMGRISFIFKKAGVRRDRDIFILLIFFIGMSSSFPLLLALDPQKAVTQYNLETWQLERGLEQKNLVSICQTSDGYIWLGTLSGLIRFDGVDFETIHNKSMKLSQDDIVWALLEDREKTLWIATGEGLFHLKRGKPVPFCLEKPPKPKQILTICQDQGGAMWIGTVENGLIRLKNGEATHYSTDNGLTSNKVRALVEDDKGRLWIGTSKGLSIHDPNKPGKFTAYKKVNEIFNKNVYSMWKRKNGEIWVGCSDGLYRMKDNGYDHWAKDLPNPLIKSLFEDSDGNLWAGTEGSGLLRITGAGVETFPAGHRLANDYIYAILEDREKNLWLCSVGEGLHCMRDTLFTSYTIWEGLKRDEVKSVCESRDGSFWLGTAKGVFHMKYGKLSLKWTAKDGLLSDNVTAVLEDNSGVIWIGTGKGLNRYKDGKILAIGHIKSIENREILRLGKDQKGAVWVITENKLGRFHLGEYKEFKGIEGHLRRLYFDRGDNAWIATYGNGVYQLSGEGEFKHYKAVDGLVHNEVESVYEDQAGNIYIGTRGGISVIKEGKINNITTQNGLLDSFIRHIIEDEYGYLWLPGRKGLSRIAKKQLLDFTQKKRASIQPVLFNESDGLKGLYTYQCTRARNGTLLFATDKGLAIVNPSNIKNNNNRLPPLVAQELMMADGISHYFGSQQPGYSRKNPLELEPGISRLEFYYTGLSFIKSRQLRFMCKLEGYDKKWVKRDTIRNTSYTGLAPGKYVFRVKAGNSDDIWSDEAAVYLQLNPYFTQTTWFYILVIFTGCLFTFLIYSLRVRSLKNRQKELTMQVESRTREIEDQKVQLEEQSEKLRELDQVKSRFFANISHEFRTPLTLLLGPLGHMIDNCEEDEKKRKLTLMQRNAQRLLRLINQLLELSKLDSGKMKLKSARTCINFFVHGITESFQFMAQQKELELVFRSGLEQEEIILFVDPRKMEDVMSNLLINAFKFTPCGGKIEVEIKCNGKEDENFPQGYVEISVSDTGPGIPTDQLPNVFDRFYQADSTYEYHQKGSGIGLALCKELVELHNGTIGVISPEGQGSTFYIRLPLDPAASDSDDPVASDPDIDFTVREQMALEMIAEEECDGKNDKDSDPDFPLTIEPETTADKREIILVVEDSADMRQYIKQALETDYMVLEAKDGNEGIEMAQSVIPDLIVSDVMMPGKDGNELCRTLKGDVQTSHIPIILLTAKASEENILEGLETGADDYVTKPFSTTILAARIKNLIDLRSQLQQNFKRELSLRPVKTSVSAIDREFLKDLQKVMKENISEPDFNVEEMCKKLYLSNTTLYRKIQALCGLTPTEFIRSYRLKQAVQLLKNGFGSVTEVAFEVGFSSRAYFTKCFREKFHQLPSEIRCEHG